MNALIIEDEKAAVRNLTALLSEAAPHIGVVAVLQKVSTGSVPMRCPT